MAEGHGVARPRFFIRLKGTASAIGYTVWVTGNYRITFGWEDSDAIEVDLEDYHGE
jgi:plasmid maintenance system killer protein